jgi:hypothetical protein
MGMILYINVDFLQMFPLLQIGIIQLQQILFMLYTNAFHLTIIYY